MFSLNKESVNTNVSVFQKVLEAEQFRGVLLKSNPDKIRKTHQKASVMESFFSPAKLDSAMLQYSCFHGKFSENFQNGFFTKTALGSCFASIVLT